MGRDAETLVAISAAAGKTGRAIVAELSSHGVACRPLVRRASGLFGEVVTDLLDPQSVSEAIAGATSIYHFAPNMHPREEQIGRTMINAAVTAGIDRFVFHSVLHPQTSAMPHHIAKLRVEDALIDSPLSWTILQPGVYAENFVRPSGVGSRLPIHPDAPFDLLHLGDLAEVARIVLTQAGHEHAVYELAGPRRLSFRQLADLVGVAVEHRSAAEWERQAEASGMDQWKLEGFKAMFRYYAAHGLCGNSRVLSTLLGRAPTDVADLVAATR